MRERYKRALRWRAVDELEEARDEYRKNIADTINNEKICKSEAKRDTQERQRKWELTSMELEGRLYSVLVRRKDIMQRLRTAGREREDVRDRDELLVSKIDDAKGGGR